MPQWVRGGGDISVLLATRASQDSRPKRVSNFRNFLRRNLLTELNSARRNTRCSNVRNILNICNASHACVRTPGVVQAGSRSATLLSASAFCPRLINDAEATADSLVWVRRSEPGSWPQLYLPPIYVFCIETTMPRLRYEIGHDLSPS